MKKKRVWRAAGFLVLAMSLVVLASVVYGRFIYKTVAYETNDYVQELAEQSIRLINERVNNDYQYLEGIADSIAIQKSDIYADRVLEILEERSHSTRFTSLAVVDLDGEVYSKEFTSEKNVSNHPYFKEAAAGHPYVESVIQEDDKQFIIASVPIIREDMVVGVILGEYAAAEFQELVHIDYFDGGGLVYLLRPDGEVLVKDQKDKMDADSLEDFVGGKRNHIEAEDAERMRNDMETGKNGTVSYSRDGNSFLLNYTAIGISDWYLISIIPEEFINSRTAYMFKATTCYGIVIIIILGGVALWAFRGYKAHHKKVETAYDSIRSIYRTVPGAIVYFAVKEEGQIISANQTFYHTMECTREEFAEKYGGQFLRVLEPEEKEWFEDLKEGLVSHEFSIPARDGGRKWLLGNFDVKYREGRLTAQAAFADVTFQRERFTRAELAARIDPLTKLKNQRGVGAELSELLTETDAKGAFLVLDMDNFKQVNDTFGHPVGDKILQKFAGCIREVFRSDDFGGRYGGDEFIVFMCGVSEKTIVLNRTRMLMGKLAESIPEEIKTLGVGISIGAAFAPKDGSSFPELYRKADKALYESKRRGKHCCCFWEEEMNQKEEL